MQAVAEHPRVAVRAGHKVSKSHSAACIAHWWIATRPKAMVVMTSSSARQVEEILWKEFRAVYFASKVKLGPEPAHKPSTGYRLADGRAVIGFSTDKPERMAGISGANVLFIIDEASGVPEEIFEAVEGNRAGGARVLLLGNPTQTSGTFFEAFGTKSSFWKTLHVSSEESPNVRAGKVVVPGLATLEWIEEKREEWGEDSPIFAVRVRGNFPTQASDSVVGLGYVLAAVERWKESQDEGEGRLHLGVDPARFGDDEAVVAPRRGLRAYEMHTFQGLDGRQLAGEVRRIARELRNSVDEIPVVKVDEIGIGASVVDHLQGCADIELIPVNVAEVATAEGYHLLRDQIWFGVANWLKAGGAIPDDGKLTGDLVAPRYGFDARGRQQVEPKAETKKRLKRSPDRADALGLAIYEAPVPTNTIDWNTLLSGLPGRRY